MSGNKTRYNSAQFSVVLVVSVPAINKSRIVRCRVDPGKEDTNENHSNDRNNDDDGDDDHDNNNNNNNNNNSNNSYYYYYY